MVHSNGDDGRGLGVVSTKIPLDREERRALLIPLIVGDGASPSLSSTVTLTLHVADVNDNPMAPASKVITVHTVQPQTTPVPLGRIYVEDPDDWDAASKTYQWEHRHHPSFLLNRKTGDLSMKPATRDGRYVLYFSVSDASQAQSGVRANVTVNVKSLSHLDVKSATPVTLVVDPYRVVRRENKTSVLQRIVTTIRMWLSSGRDRVDAIAVQKEEGPPVPLTRIWITSAPLTNLHHILLHHKQELEQAVDVKILSIGVGTCRENIHTPSHHCSEGCSTRVSLATGFSVIDANTSALVGPWVNIQHGCTCNIAHIAELDMCTPNTCFNGGQCVPMETGTRCICPHGTTGSHCKILIRHFLGEEESGEDKGGGGKIREGGSSDGDGPVLKNGWAWVPSLPSCAEIHISFEFFTSKTNANLLFTGPHHLDFPFLSPSSPSLSDSSLTSNSDMFSLVLHGGRPSLMLDLGAGAVHLNLNASYTLSDSLWHRIDVIWKDELVEMIVDLCSGGSIDGPHTKHDMNLTSASVSAVPPDAHTCRGAARLPKGAQVLNVPHPLQLGGISHLPPDHSVYGWPSPIIDQPFRGCLRNIRINGEIVDLGHRILSERSSPGCSAVDCSANGIQCGIHGRCYGSPGYLRCECQSGWSDSQCSTETVPAAFQLNSYVKLALSFTPLAYTTTIHLRFRTWKREGELTVLSSQHGRDKLSLKLLNGNLCLELQLHPDISRLLCLTKPKLTDGQWHIVAASRYGSATFLSVDDGGSDLYNASVALEGRQLLEVDKQEGVHVGGSPEYVGLSVFNIHGDYYDGCIDDVRISGKSVPLPPALNSTSWGQASMFKGVESGCQAPSSCTNVSCRAPLSCIDTWRSYHCGCGTGRMLSVSKTTCDDINECAWSPCLNGGTCFNKQSGRTRHVGHLSLSNKTSTFLTILNGLSSTI
ncbi:hypothetical protein SK128_007151 [Halocaridina rubra]|uniref:Neural-cadherin n=1 Tax=Halocaridina rubra TaxID=373956 RepID=A0AAN8X567_HALRR